MNKEVILGIAGVGATAVVVLLAAAMLSDEPTQKSVETVSVTVAGNKSVPMGVADPTISGATNAVALPAQSRNHGGFQNCFTSWITMMCKPIANGKQLIPSIFQGSIVCPTNFPRAG